MERGWQLDNGVLPFYVTVILVQPALQGSAAGVYLGRRPQRTSGFVKSLTVNWVRAQL